MASMKTEAGGIAHYNLYIDGEWVESTPGEVIEVENPANEEIYATVPAASEDEVQRALESAEKAQPEWARLPASQRGDGLIKLADGVRERKEDIARR